MGKKRFHWEKGKGLSKKKKFIIIAAIVLVILAAFVLLGVGYIGILLGDGLVLSVKPIHTVVDAEYDELVDFAFDVSISNEMLCNARCNYSFVDVSDNRYIDSGMFEAGNLKFFSKKYEVMAGKRGSGQKIYRFRVECGTFGKSCIAQERSATAIGMLNYQLSNREEGLKKMFAERLPGDFQKINTLVIQQDELLKKKALLTGKVIFDEELIIPTGKIEEIVLQAEMIRTLWNEEQYLAIDEQYDKFKERMQSIEASLTLFDTAITEAVTEKNTLIDLYNDLAQEQFYLITTVREASEQVNDLTLRLNRAARLLEENQYDMLLKELESIEESQRNIYEEVKQDYLFRTLQQQYALTIEENLQKMLLDQEVHFTIDPMKENYASVIAGNVTPSSCGALTSLSVPVEENVTIEAAKLLENITMRNAVLSMIVALRETIIQDYQTLLDGDEKFVNISKSILQPSLVAYSVENISEDYFNKLKVYVIYAFAPLTKDALANCSMPVVNQLEHNQLDILEDIVVVDEKETLNMTFSENLPLCCILGKCKPCCVLDECKEAFPVLFLHGHAFSEKRMPDFSLYSFDKLQEALHHDGFLDFGTITHLDGSLGEGVWQHASPLTLKASYYYDSYYKGEYIIVPRKTENIDTYAIRLKEMIDMTKLLTGKDKVVIIAHSMGGLVARRYMQIFGEHDVDKLIMMGTPNFGIKGRILKFCDVFGATKECQDMAADSLFINKLNDPKRQPTRTETYMIIGTGCDMSGEDGDGVVTKASATLFGVENHYIEGSCDELLNTLHSDLLDISKYPEVYGIIMEILRE